MAYQFSYNTMANGVFELFYNFKTLLKANGWTVMSSSDGLTYFPASDGITGGAAGAGGMRNNHAWFRIRQPTGGAAPYAGTREFVFQVYASNFTNDIRVKYSATGVFTTGSPSATQTPAAADEMYWVGGINDASPTYKYFSFNSMADIGYVAVNDTAPFNWYICYARPAPGTHEGAFSTLCWDALIQTPWDATKPLLSDPEPYVFLYNGQQANAFGQMEFDWSRTIVTVDGTRHIIPTASPYWIGGSNTRTASIVNGPVNPYNGNTDIYPVYYTMINSTSGSNPDPNWKAWDNCWRGFSCVLDFDGAANFQRDRGTLYTLNDRIKFGTVWFPWNGGAV